MINTEPTTDRSRNRTVKRILVGLVGAAVGTLTACSGGSGETAPDSAPIVAVDVAAGNNESLLDADVYFGSQERNAMITEAAVTIGTALLNLEATSSGENYVNRIGTPNSFSLEVNWKDSPDSTATVYVSVQYLVDESGETQVIQVATSVTDTTRSDNIVTALVSSLAGTTYELKPGQWATQSDTPNADEKVVPGSDYPTDKLIDTDERAVETITYAAEQINLIAANYGD